MAREPNATATTVVAAAAPRLVSDCKVDGAVIGTVASAAYERPLMNLAQGAAMVGFPCIVVQPYTEFDALRSPLLRALPIPRPPLLPRAQWCGTQRYGWRRSHLHRTQMWHALLTLGIDLLAVDLDWSFLDIRGQPLRLELPMRSLREARTSTGAMPDVIALHDGSARGLFNVGLMWIRASASTVALATRCVNRSFAGWEQGVFNEELGFGTGATLHCCHAAPRAACDLRSFTRSVEAVHNLGHEQYHSSRRRRVEGEDTCTARLPLAADPPKSSTYLWEATAADGGALSGWHGDRYSSLKRRPLTRCTALANTCRCPTLPDDDEHWRALGGVRIRHYLEKHPEHINLTVRGRAFHRGLAATSSSSRRSGAELTPSSRRSGPMSGPQPPTSRLAAPDGDMRPVLLREWLGWKPSLQRNRKARKPSQSRRGAHNSI